VLKKKWKLTRLKGLLISVLYLAHAASRSKPSFSSGVQDMHVWSRTIRTPHRSLGDLHKKSDWYGSYKCVCGSVYQVYLIDAVPTPASTPTLAEAHAYQFCSIHRPPPRTLRIISLCENLAQLRTYSYDVVPDSLGIRKFISS
jgi:hypothetical protein